MSDPVTQEEDGRAGLAIAAAAESSGPPVGGRIERLTTWLAVIGGVLLLVSMAVTLISVIGRYAFNAPLPGDYELVELTCAVGIFLFFPYTHAMGGNISALFFSAALPVWYQRLLDLLNDVIFTGVAILLAWRLANGLKEKFFNGETTMLIQIPLWWAYCFAVGSMALLAIVCIGRIVMTGKRLHS